MIMVQVQCEFLYTQGLHKICVLNIHIVHTVVYVTQIWVIYLFHTIRIMTDLFTLNTPGQN